MKNNTIDRVPVADFISEMSEESGFSVEICRRALNAQTEAVLKFLAQGKSVHIPGLATISPYLVKRMTKGGVFRETVQVKIAVSTIIENKAEELDGFNREQEEEVGEEIRLRQISSLM